METDKIDVHISPKDYLEQFGELARIELMAAKIRRAAIDNITKSGVGHPGGSLSVTDILAVLYFGRLYDPATGRLEPVMRYDPAEPFRPDRDRVILSKGHAAPALYATLAEAGFFSPELLKIYRKIDSPLEGHPAMFRSFEEAGRKLEHGTKGVDFCTGSLGHGLAVSAGMALHAKIYGYDYHIYTMLGDGELQEGMVWESFLTAANKKLNNICAFVDYNHLQCDGAVDDINSLHPLDEKLKAFNWDVRVIDGHDIYAIIEVLDYFKKTRSQNPKPLMIIANTVKGKGVKEIENDYRYHALPLTPEQYERADNDFKARIACLEKELGARKTVCRKPEPSAVTVPEPDDQDLAEIIRKNPYRSYSEPTATRLGYGNALARLGEYKKIFVLNADISGACGTAKFIEKYPENAGVISNRRSMNVGIQEANMMSMAAGLAACGKIPVVNSFGVFSTGRAWEMVRQDISFPRLNVKIIGSHTGIALGEYGVSHQSLADVSLMCALPHIVVIEPSDAVQADLLFEKVLLYEGPVYFRLGRNPSPLLYCTRNSGAMIPVPEFEIGKGYQLKEGNDITLICSGPITAQALEAARKVKESVRVVDMPTIRPIDAEIIEKAALETGRICTVQDHFENGGLKAEVLNVIAQRRLQVEFDFVALAGFAESGSPAALYEKYGLSADCIIKKLKLTLKRQ